MLDVRGSKSRKSCPQPRLHQIACSAFFMFARLWGPGTHLYPPHDESANPVINCLHCHALYDSTEPNLPRGLDQETMCKTCHNPTGQASAKYRVANHVVLEGTKTIDCGTCHDPHGGRIGPTDNTARGGALQDNITLIRNSPFKYEPGALEPVFHQRPDHFAFGTGNGPYNGICNVCHTQTLHHRREGIAGGDHDHGIGQDCTSCHRHDQGFLPGESGGGGQCSACHTEIWNGISTGSGKASAHWLGGVVGVADNPSDSGLDWGSPTNLSQNAVDQRSCVNMCHIDHEHNAPGFTEHHANVHENPRTSSSRAVSRDGNNVVTAGTVDSTDFDASAPTGGLCVSCHDRPIVASGMSIDRDAFATSKHNYTFDGYGTWSYTLHDGSTFARNCTKCHSDPADAIPNAGVSPFGAVHFSDFDSLLNATPNPDGSWVGFLCFNCHGNGTVGTDRSGKELVSAFSKTYAHPVISDNVHSAGERAASYDDGTYGGAGRHVNCADCHNPHSAGPTLHTAGSPDGNLIAVDSPLFGASGIAFDDSGLTLWEAPTSSQLSWVSSATYEYELCFKCHSSFAFGTAPPLGLSGVVETDVAQEFSSKNRSGHPIVTGLNNYTNSTTPRALNANKMQPGWTDVGNQTMTCSDCHGNDVTTGELQGAHGSASPFLLKGPNTFWPTNGSGTLYDTGDRNTNDNHLAGIFCRNCHTLRTATGEGRDPAVWYGNMVHAAHGGDRTQNVACIRCHLLVPHGGKLSRLIGDGNGAMPARYAYQNNLSNTYAQEFIKPTDPTSYADTNCESTCHSVTINGENW